MKITIITKECKTKDKNASNYSAPPQHKIVNGTR